MLFRSVEGWADHITGNANVGYTVSPSPFTWDGTIHVTIEDNVVTQIDGYALLFDYFIGDLVEQLGDPEWLYPTSRATRERTCEGWEPPTEPVQHVPVHLLYPSQGLWFLALVPFGGLGLVCPEMRVITFSYYAPYSIEDILEGRHPLAMSTALENATEQGILEWHGFGGY